MLNYVKQLELILVILVHNISNISNILLMPSLDVSHCVWLQFLYISFTILMLIIN